MLDNFFSVEEVSQFRVWMNWADNFVLTAHVSPDGDAVGSSLALALFLRSKGKNAVVALPDMPPEFLMCLPGADSIISFDKDPDRVNSLLDKADVICCLDYNAIGRVGDMASHLLFSKAKKIMLDHHPYPGPFCDVVLSRPRASSTSEIIFHFLCALGEWGNINSLIAECICAGMMTDTGGFTYNSNDSQFFFALSQLIDKGVDKDALYRRIYHNYTESRLRMTGYVLAEKMVLLRGTHIALITLTADELERFHSRQGDTEGFVNLPLQMSGVLFSAFLREDKARGVIKLSLRSVGDVPCNRFASEYFHGGGHANASGGEFDGSMDEGVEAFYKAVDEWRLSKESCIMRLFDN